MKILYINYVNCNHLLSGSRVRPARILKALQETGHEIIVLTGEQSDSNRKEKIKEIEYLIKQSRPDICYIESPTYPIMLHKDRRLISRLHHMGVPVGYFYRDFYRKFPEQFPRRKSISGRIKDFALNVLQFLTDRVLTNCDIVYFPSIEATRFFHYKHMKALPPAGENRINMLKRVNHVGIYVGGVIGHYDCKLLLDAFKVLHEEDPSYRLILVCRNEEWAKFSHPCKTSDWLEVYHLSGKDLEPLYERASIAFVMPDCSFSYNQFAVSVKTFEYISYGLPVVAVNCGALKRLVEGEEIGLAVNPVVDDFVTAVKSILANQSEYDKWREKVQKALLERNLWEHRVDTIIKDLSKL